MDAVVRTDTDNASRRESGIFPKAMWSGVSWGATGAVPAAAWTLALLALGGGNRPGDEAVCGIPE
jgi:hypothetical protein